MIDSIRDIRAWLGLWLSIHVAWCGAALSDENSQRPQAASQTPVIPVGLDAYRMWDRWPYQRIGACAYMRSTCDRRGGNETADPTKKLARMAAIGEKA